jgi:GNAT superfamily N-acetyltransferase
MLRSRLYRDEFDLRRMQALLCQARRQTGDWSYPHLGDLGWWFFMVLCHQDPCQDIRLWFSGEQLAAYAILGEDPTFDVQVLPAFAGTGIEAQALAWAETRLHALRGQDPARWGGPLLSGARQDDSARIAFLEQHGFRPAPYVEVNCLRRLDGPPPPIQLPPGCQVRPVRPDAGEIAARAGLQAAVWQPYTVGNVGAADYARFLRLPGYLPELDLVAVAPDGALAAYVNAWIDPLNRVGDLGPVGAHPDYRRRGYTRLVLLEALRRLHALGMLRVTVSTGEGNTPARRLYESLGFEVENRYVQFARRE